MNTTIYDYLKHDTCNENANTSFSISGLKAHIAASILRESTLSQSPAADYHRSGALHLHDLSGGIWSAYCRGMDLMQLLMEGVKNPSGTSSTPAKHFDVAVDHVVNSMYVSQNEWEGAQAYSNFDTLLAPFIYYDNLDFRCVKQSIQRAVFNLSYPLRAAFQTPFTNWSFDLKCPDHMKNEPVIIGGLPQDRTYSEFQDEMDMINLAFIEVMMEGDKNGNPHTFPIPTYSITKDFDWDCEVTTKLFKLTAKFGTPYFMNYIGSGLDPSSTRSMCCRLNLRLEDVVEASKGGLWNAGVGTGSLSVVTINMPQLGYLAHKDAATHGVIGGFATTDMIKAFYRRLDILLEAAHKHSEWKRKKINEGFEMGLMPFSKSYMKNFNSFFSTIGLVGMNECCLNMFGKPIYECVDFVDGVLDYMHNYVRKLTKEHGHPYNLEESPAEGCSHSLALKDRMNYPGIITQGEGDGAFYTNSSHIYVGDEIGLGESLRIQERFKRHYNGGTLFHIFCGESAPDAGGVKDLIKSICTNTSIPYIALTRAYAVCEKCGVIDDLSGTCPSCGSDTTVWDRVTGFYRPVTAYNKGKKAEFETRHRFDNSDTGAQTFACTGGSCDVA